nr:hypothetical protein [Tanacetum cinerariifolium]
GCLDSGLFTISSLEKLFSELIHGTLNFSGFQWKSRIKRYIDTKATNPPYELGWKDKEVPTSKGIDNDIYSTVDACLNACEMWKAIERLKQGESINVQDLETNLYWEFGKFTSQDGESLES